MAILIRLVGALVVCSALAIIMVVITAIVGAVAAALAYLTSLCVADCKRRATEVGTESKKVWTSFVAWVKKQARAFSIQSQRLARRVWSNLCWAYSKVSSKVSGLFSGVVDAIVYTVGAAIGRGIVNYFGRRFTFAAAR